MGARLLGVVAVAVSLLAGCSGGSDDEGSGTTIPTTERTTTTSTLPPPPSTTTTTTTPFPTEPSPIPGVAASDVERRIRDNGFFCGPVGGPRSDDYELTACALSTQSMTPAFWIYATTADELVAVQVLDDVDSGGAWVTFLAGQPWPGVDAAAVQSWVQGVVANAGQVVGSYDERVFGAVPFSLSTANYGQLTLEVGIPPD